MKRSWVITIASLAIIFTAVILFGPELAGDYMKDKGEKGIIKIGNAGLMGLEYTDYDYQPGDILLIWMNASPDADEIVYYNALANNCTAGFGPGRYLARIVGLPGDRVIFSGDSYTVRGRSYAAERRYYDGTNFVSQLMGTRNLVWGNLQLDEMTGREMSIPDNEYLADKWICPGRWSIGNRFTIFTAAIIGTVIMKVGHSQILEKAVGSRVY